MSVDIKVVEVAGAKRCQVSSPFNPNFILGARELNGKWLAGPKIWSFDARDEQAVRDICRSVYGTDGSDEVVETTTLKVHVGGEWGTGLDPDLSEIWIAGRCILKRLNRDSPVRMGEGVHKLSGTPFRQSAGSARYPAIGERHTTDVVLLVRDVPVPLAQEEVKRYANAISIVEEEEAQSDGAGG